jgi:hypothetical protein
LESDPLLVDLHATTSKQYILPTTLPTLSTSENDVPETKKPAELTLVAVFDRTGSYIYTGTSKGHFNVIDVETREVLLFTLIFRLKAPSLSSHLVFARRPSNISDSPIRVATFASTALTALYAQSPFRETRVSAQENDGIRTMVVMMKKRRRRTLS